VRLTQSSLCYSIVARSDRRGFPRCHVLARIYDESSQQELFGYAKRRA
jgi:hypothetical protein